MVAFLLYIFKASICLILFYICFKALFSNDTFFRFNRWLLLAGIAVCLLLPAIPVKTDQVSALQQPFYQLENLVAGTSQGQADTNQIQTEAMHTAGSPQPDMTIPWGLVIGIIYLSGCLFCFATTLLSFHRMSRIFRTGKHKREGTHTLILIPASISPFSWGRYIILSEEDYANHPYEILTHECMHIHYRHSLDLIFMETVLIFHWFNPAIWLLKRELRDIHEYQADKGVLNQGIDATKYQLLLVKKAVGSSLYTLANSFNHSKIKKRITMMLRKKSNGWARLKLLLLVPVGLTALSVFARPEITDVSATVLPSPMPVQTDVTALPVPDKGINLQQQTKAEYGVYLSFVEKDIAGKDSIGGISIYSTGVSEEKALKIVENAIKNGTFQTASKVFITPFNERVPASYLEKIKNLYEANNIKCKINPPTPTHDKDGKEIPPPPPPAPDVYVTFQFNNGKKEAGLIIYERYLKTGTEISKRLNEIKLDGLSKVIIKTKKNAPAGIAEQVEKLLQEKIKKDVPYEVKN